MEEKAYQEIIKAQVHESEKVNQLTMIGFALFGVITIKASGKLTLNIWMFYAFISWGIELFIHYFHSMINRDSIYLTKKNEYSINLEKLRKDNIKEMKSVLRYQSIAVAMGFIFFVVGIAGYYQYINIIKSSNDYELFAAFIILIIAVITITCVVVRSQMNSGNIPKLLLGVGFTILAIIASIDACDHCKEITSMIGRIFLYSIPTGFFLISISIILHCTCEPSKPKDQRQTWTDTFRP